MEVKHKKTGEVYDLQCQQYTIGLYVCIYKNGRMYDQFGLNTTKEQFMLDMENNKFGFEIVK